MYLKETRCLCRRCQESLGSVFPERLLKCVCSSETLWAPFTCKTSRGQVFIVELVIFLLEMLRDVRFGVPSLSFVYSHRAHICKSQLLSETQVFKLTDRMSTGTLLQNNKIKAPE